MKQRYHGQARGWGGTIAARFTNKNEMTKAEAAINSAIAPNASQFIPNSYPLLLEYRKDIERLRQPSRQEIFKRRQEFY